MTALLVLAGVTALVLILFYSLFAPWWTSRAGTAVFALYATLGAIVLHFMAEALWGQAAAWREIALVLVLEAVMLWNLATIILKQVLARRNQEEGHR